MKFIKIKLIILIVLITSCSTTKSSVFIKKDYDRNLVGHWALEGNAIDQSKYKSNGRIFGDPQQVNSTIDGKALDFNGDDYIEIGVDGKSPDHFKALSQGSISLWFKTRTWDVQTEILPILYYGKADPCPGAFDGTNGGMVIEVGHGGIFPSKNIFFTAYDQLCEFPTMCFDSNDGKGLIVPGKWYHFVVVVGEDYNTGYLNGQELLDRRYNFQSDSTSLFFSDFTSHDKLWIGKGYWKEKEVYFDGLIDDVRIYNTPLNLEDIQYLYKVR
jgi:hypothetical protein